MKVRLGFAVLSCLVAASALADDLRFDPPNPNPHTSVVVLTAGDWPFAYCGPRVSSVTTEGRMITVSLATSQGFGDSFCSSRNQARVPLGIRPAGIYTVVVVLDDVERARAILTVRDDTTLLMRPYAVPMSGGDITIRNPFHPDDPEVTIDGAKVQTSGGPVLFMGAPAHAPGAVDVTVTRGSDTITAKAALIYYDPVKADPAVFEPVLFPVSFDGAGAFGSRWTTENTLEFHSGSRFRDFKPCSFCVHPERLANPSKPWGQVMYALRGTIDETILRSVLYEQSRGGVGTSIPVVRENDFRGPIMRFRMKLPSGGPWRAMVRVWTVTEPRGGYHVISYPNGSIPLPMTRIPNAEMWFGSLDVTPFLADTSYFGVQPRNFATPLRWWAMLSITNNQTQQVTIEPAW